MDQDPKDQPDDVVEEIEQFAELEPADADPDRPIGADMAADADPEDPDR